MILVTLLQYSLAMATTPQIPPPNQPQPPISVVANAAAANAAQMSDPKPDASQALVPVLDEDEFSQNFNPELDGLELTGPLALLPIELDVTVPIRDFRVRELLALEPGQLIETQWHNGDDVPLSAADVHLAWSEFEVIETDLAVRITRLP